MILSFRSRDFLSGDRWRNKLTNDFFVIKSSCSSSNYEISICKHQRFVRLSNGNQQFFCTKTELSTRCKTQVICSQLNCLDKNFNLIKTLFIVIVESQITMNFVVGMMVLWPSTMKMQIWILPSRYLIRPLRKDCEKSPETDHFKVTCVPSISIFKPLYRYLKKD